MARTVRVAPEESSVFLVQVGSVSHSDLTTFDPMKFGKTAAAAVRAIAGLASSDQIHAGVILGSGLGDAVERLPLADLQVVEFQQIPDMVLPGIKGHKGRLILGKLGQHRIAFLLGRLHAYEGHSTARLLSGIALLNGLGIRQLVVTNAAGGISPGFSVGDLMVISDHIRYPGCGFVDWAQTVQDDSTAAAMVPRMPAMAPVVWSQTLVKIALKVPSTLNIHQGTYAMMPGPMYETPAEIRMMRSLGVDAVGMSTVPESIFAASRGIEVLGVSCITNVAAGLSDQPLCHAEVTATAASIEQRFSLWLEDLLPAVCR